MVYALANLTASQSQKVGLSIAHFQKKQGALYCSKFSVIEVLVDVSTQYCTISLYLSQLANYMLETGKSCF